MTAFSSAFTSFFAALTVLFSAFKSAANTLNNLAVVAEESSGAYKDQARIDRAQKLRDANKLAETNVTAD